MKQFAPVCERPQRRRAWFRCGEYWRTAADSRASDYVLIALDLLTIKLDEAMSQQLDADVSKAIH